MSKKSNNRQEFLKTFFNKDSKNDIRFMNGFVLFKHFDGNIKDWRVSIFTKDSWKKMRKPPKKIEKEKKLAMEKANKELEEKYLTD